MRRAARTTTDAPLAARALAFDAGIFERGADRVLRVGDATVLLTPSLPSVAHLNFVHVHAPLDASRVEALAHEHHSGLPSLRVVVDDPAHSERFAAELRARGWAVHQLVFMSRDGTAEPPTTAALAEEVPYGHVRGLREEWLRAGDWALEGDQLEATLEGDARLFAGTPPRAFAIFETGRPIAYALLLTDGRDGAVEDVYTTPSARGRGLATAAVAAVLHAARSERCEAVFVATAGEGGASGLYERLGFTRVVVQHHFGRPAR